MAYTIEDTMYKRDDHALSRELFVGQGCGKNDALGRERRPA
jgi:hypothetical protein